MTRSETADSLYVSCEHVFIDTCQQAHVVEMTFDPYQFEQSCNQSTLFCVKFLQETQSCLLVIRGSTGGFLLLRDINGVVSQPRGLRVS